MPAPDKNDILNSLRKVNDPDLHKDIVTLNMVKSVKIEDKSVYVEVELTTPACPLKDLIKQNCVKAIKDDFPSLERIDVVMGARVSSVNTSVKEALLPNVKNTIAVASGKGGVGKSTIAVNLAVALAKDGAKVGLIDADIYGPSIPLMLGIKGKPTIYQSAATQKMIPLENFGIKMMSIGFLVDDSAPVIWRGPMASSAVKQFMSDVEWDDIDYLIFDLPPGTGDIQLTLVQTIPLTGAVIVTTPQQVAVADARKGMKMFQRLNVPVFGVIENMSYFVAPDTGKRYDIFGSNGGKDLADEMNASFLGGIPIDPRIAVGGDKGTPIIYDMPDSENANAIMGIARNLAAQVSIRNLDPESQKIEISLDDNE